MRIDAEAAAMIEAMKNDLLIVLIERLGGKIDIPVKEVDEKPKGAALTVAINDAADVFSFRVVRKAS